MKPDKVSIHDLFQRDRRYTVPLYQRSYVWSESEQWEPLWEDIERQAEAWLPGSSASRQRSHFLGAVVLNVARIVGSSVARSAEIIDGQQRLTTLQLFLGALRDFAVASNSEHASRFQRLTINDYEAPGSENSLKVWPTNADRDLFMSAMTAGSPEALLNDLGVARTNELPRIGAAYAYFYARVTEYAGRDGPDAAAVNARLLALLQALRTGLQLVVIELEDDDDPQVIFETLNARGQPLLPSDLIRNTVFHQAAVDPAHSAEQGYADRLYEQYWRPFDVDRLPEPINGEDRYWHVLERQGRLTRPRIDLFIFHFLTVQTGSELNIGHLFQEFRDWRSQSNETLEQFLAQLKRYAAVFRRLMSPQGDDLVSTFARRLRALDTSTVYPVLMYLLALPVEKLSKADQDKSIEYIESWMIRRFVCQMTNKNYNKFFNLLLNRIKQAASESENSSAAIVDAIRQELLRSREDTGVWPSDAEFERSWIENAVYVKSRPDRAVMLLSALDMKMRSSKNESITLPAGLTVEHLLPQRPSLDDYPYVELESDPGDEPTDRRRSRLIHTVGNLTLMTQALNSSISNGPFAAKRPEIAENSALRLNARFQDPSITRWDENDIQKRGRELFDLARQIWRSPPTSVSPGASSR
ncbi:MAG: hypothetical protein DI565_16000 [Ancylobacter novellus]|uniref:DUF262 domain-containing protein n=1 Tax=Ancylobacter novellus TaxID=921 RepID=A0A2W5M4K4_ANCNO|nr:MAG: hypothetical protein DI565_16000 [Ancylobacter novellus]